MAKKAASTKSTAKKPAKPVKTEKVPKIDKSEKSVKKASVKESTVKAPKSQPKAAVGKKEHVKPEVKQKSQDSAVAESALAPVKAESTASRDDVASAVVKPSKAEKAKAAKAARAAAADAKALSEEAKKWAEIKEVHGDEKASAYSMNGVYEANTALLHKILGWGWIVNVINDRLEVLFETGTKTLISNRPK